MDTDRGCSNVPCVLFGIFAVLEMAGVYLIESYPLGLQTSGLGLHQRQPSYLPDYNGIFSLQALNFTPAAIDKTEKFLQILHADNPLAPNISLAALLTTQEGRQHASTDQTTDRLNPEQTEVGDYFNEVDSGNVKLHFDSGITKPHSEGSDFSDSRLDSEGSDFSDLRLDSDPGSTKPDSNLDLDSSNTKLSSDSSDSNLELDSSNVKLYSGSAYSKLNSNSTNIELTTDTIITNTDAKNASTTTNGDYTNPKVDLESGHSGDPNREEVNPKVSGETHNTNSLSDDNNLKGNTQDILTTALPQIQLDSKTINGDLLQTSETQKNNTESEKLLTTQAEDLFSTSDRTSQVAQSNSSDVSLTDSEKVEKQPDIFDHLMATIQSHWSDFVGKMKLSVLDVWKTISQQMMVRLENFATAL
ncbi:hypothetical protein JTE90_025948 [Oedothorax gibbosus]|uniref:Uncharacterized protein n=1 Tax=Oedothorax gibbosus TaxID=931172 RepID=A0AAV6TX95_9ARAC|nr:hypothetical protein JTE90_025948 [Oedothorax gibbosus]